MIDYIMDPPSFDGSQGLLAIIIDHVSSEVEGYGVKFFTEGTEPQQVAYMLRPTGEVIEPHYHQGYKRTIELTQEVIIVLAGCLQVDIYNSSKEHIASKILYRGAIAILMAGGHGFKVLQEVELIEVKQGPYSPVMDKVRFNP